MTKNIEEINAKLKALLMAHENVLKVTQDSEDKFEVHGTVEAMQGKKKVDGIYFSSVVPKQKDVRFYFFPTYTHADKLTPLPENLAKALKGKSCFHIKYLDLEMIENLKKLITRAVKLYQEDGLLAK